MYNGNRRLKNERLFWPTQKILLHFCITFLYYMCLLHVYYMCFPKKFTETVHGVSLLESPKLSPEGSPRR